jgi:hypothetical protein
VARQDAVPGGDFGLVGEAQRQRLIAVASDRLKLNQLEA